MTGSGRRPRQRRFLAWGLVLLVVWPASVVVGAWVDPTFQAAVEVAASKADGPLDKVVLHNGSYTTLPFVFMTRVKVGFRTTEGERLAEVKLFHVPLLGIRALSGYEGWWGSSWRAGSRPDGSLPVR